MLRNVGAPEWRLRELSRLNKETTGSSERPMRHIIYHMHVSGLRRIETLDLMVKPPELQAARTYAVSDKSLQRISGTSRHHVGHPGLAATQFLL